MDFEKNMKATALQAWQVLLMSRQTTNTRLLNHDQPEHGQPRSWVELTAQHTGEGIQWYRITFHNSHLVEKPEYDFEGSFSMGWSRWAFDLALEAYDKAKRYVDAINAEEPWESEPRD